MPRRLACFSAKLLTYRLARKMPQPPHDLLKVARPELHSRTFGTEPVGAPLARFSRPAASEAWAERRRLSEARRRSGDATDPSGRGLAAERRFEKLVRLIKVQFKIVPVVWFTELLWNNVNQ